jgi:hypothetical protein
MELIAARDSSGPLTAWAVCRYYQKDGKGRRGSSRKLGTRLLGVSACCAPEWQTATAVRLLSWHAYPLHSLNAQDFCFATCWQIWQKGRDQQTKLNLTATSVLSLIVNWICNITFFLSRTAGSIPDGVTGFFNWHNPSSRTMVLGSTQPLTEMSTRSIS